MYLDTNAQKCRNTSPISNCSIVLNDDSNLTPVDGTALTIVSYNQCLQCSDGYYPIVDGGVHKCMLGTITKCKSYVTKYKCRECITNYQRFRLSNATTYDSCIPVGQDTSCA